MMNENLNNEEHQLAIGNIIKKINEYLKNIGKDDDYEVIPDKRIEDRDDSPRINVLVKKKNDVNVIGIEVCATSAISNSGFEFKLKNVALLDNNMAIYVFDYQNNEWWYKTGLSKPLESSSLDDVLKLL